MALLGLLSLPLGVMAAKVQVPPPTQTMQMTQQTVLVMVRMPSKHYGAGAGYSSAYGAAISRSGMRSRAQKVAQSFGLTVVDSWPMPLLDLECVVMSLPADRSVDAVIAAISRDPDVEWSQPVNSYVLQKDAAAYNDPLSRAQPAITQWRLADLQGVATGRGIKVAVIDSRADRNHPDLRGQISVDRNFVAGPGAKPERHGTEVAGIIAAHANNRIGVVGIAPGARIMSLRACREQSSGRPTLCDSLSLAKALQFAIEEKAHIVNLSLSGPEDRLLRRLLDIGTERGITVVAAYDARLPCGGFPASMVSVVAVSDERLTHPVPRIFVAPGNGIPTTTTGGGWGLVSGSSYAVAHVTGLLALARDRSATSRAVPRLRASRRDGGLVDACATLLIGERACAGKSQSGASVAR